MEKENKKTITVLGMNFDLDPPYMDGQMLLEANDECVLPRPQKTTNERRIDLRRLEHSSELL